MGRTEVKNVATNILRTPFRAIEVATGGLIDVLRTGVGIPLNMLNIIDETGKAIQDTLNEKAGTKTWHQLVNPFRKIARIGALTVEGAVRSVVEPVRNGLNDVTESISTICANAGQCVKKIFNTKDTDFDLTWMKRKSITEHERWVTSKRLQRKT